MSHSKYIKRGYSYYIKKGDPSSKKYIIRCGICGCKGYSPEIAEPDFIEENPDISLQNKVIYRELIKALKPLKLDDLGRCEDCAKIMDINIL